MEEWLAVVIEQYKSTRLEALESIKSQTSILNIGVGSIGLLFGAGLNFYEKPMLPEIIFLLFIPIFCGFILLSWFGEIYRMVRAGVFLAEIESKVNRYFSAKKSPPNEKALCWEQWLVNNTKLTQINVNYRGVVLLLFLVASSAIFVGTKKICLKFSALKDFPCLCIWDLIVGLSVLTVLIYIHKKSKKIINAKNIQSSIIEE